MTIYIHSIERTSPSLFVLKGRALICSETFPARMDSKANPPLIWRRPDGRRQLVRGLPCTESRDPFWSLPFGKWAASIIDIVDHEVPQGK